MPSSTQEIGRRSKADPITKRFTAKFACPPAPWSNFQLLECSEASGLKIRENAFRASDSERSQKEKPTLSLMPARGQRGSVGFLETQCSHTLSGTKRELPAQCWTDLPGTLQQVIPECPLLFLPYS